MLRVGNKDVIFSQTFMVAKGEEVRIAPPGVIAREIKIVATQLPAELQIGQRVVNAESSDELVTISVPFLEDGHFAFQIRDTQLVTKKGPLATRIAGRGFGDYMQVHFELHEGRYDNYSALDQS